MAKTPDIKELIELEELEGLVQDLNEQKTLLSQKFEVKKEEYPEEMNKLVQGYIRELLELKLKEIDAKQANKNSSDEVKAKIQITKKFAEELNKVMNQAFYQSIINKLLNKIKSEKQGYEIYVGENSVALLPKNIVYKKANKGVLRIETKDKTYILDPKIIFGNVLEYLINHNLPKTNQ